MCIILCKSTIFFLNLPKIKEPFVKNSANQSKNKRPYRPVQGGRYHQKPKMVVGGGVRRSLRLPFDPERSGGDWIDWAYRHRVGVLVSVVCYFLLAISFVTCKFAMDKKTQEVIEIQIESDILEQMQELERKQEMLKQMHTPSGQVRNDIADNRSESDRAIRQSVSDAERELYDDVQRLQDDLAAGSKAYEESLRQIDRDAQELYDQKRGNVRAEQGDRNVDKMARGNVAASFDLEGRTATYIHIPAYKCRGGGVVVVNISVNRSGKVVAAKVESALSTSDKCLEQEAVSSAMKSRFSSSTTAPTTQKGTLTYTFVAQ